MSSIVLSDKTSKKAKAFLDTSSKLKHRHAALLSLIETATEPEQLMVFKENTDYIVGFIAESVQLMFAKLGGNESVFEKALYGRERYEYLRVPQIFLLTIKPIHNLLTTEQQELILEVIRLLLHPQNLHEVRLEGLRMLLFWMKLSYRTDLLQGLGKIYETMIDLRAFTADSTVNLYEEYPIAKSWPRKTIISTIGSDRDQAIKLFHDLLHWITWDPDPDRLTVTFSWVMLRDTYLVHLYKVEHPVEEIQGMMIKFLSCWIIRTPTLYSKAFQAIPQAGVEFQADPNEEIVDPVATYLWEDLMLSGEEEVEWCHRIVQHALSLPIQWYRPTIKQAIAILRSWTFVTKERRCDFLVGKVVNRHLTLDALNKAPSRPPTPASYEDETLLNSFVIKYLDMLTSIYQTRSTSHQGELLEAFREVQFFFRTLSMQSYFKPSPTTWSNLFSNQLQITNQFMNESANIITTASVAESFAQQLIETLLGVWVRGQVTDKNEWQKLCNAFSVVVNWPTALQEWTESINCLTKLLINVFPPSSSKDSQSQPKKVADSFNAWEDLVWTKESALFLWRNMLRLIGHPNDATKDESWQLIVKTLSNTQHQLLKIRASQNYDADRLPPVYELVPWLLDIAEKGLDVPDLSSGTNLALDTLCAVMIRRHDMPFPDTHFIGFYGILIKGMNLEWIGKFPEHQLAAVATILSGSYQMFTLPLPGAEVVTEKYLQTISILMEHWNEGVPYELHGLLIPILKFLYNARETELLFKAQSLCQNDHVIEGVFVSVVSLLLAENCSEERLLGLILDFVPIDGSRKINQVVLDCLTFLNALPNIPFDAIFDRLLLALKTSTYPYPIIDVFLQCEPRLNDDQLRMLMDVLHSSIDIHSKLSLTHIQHVRKLFPAFYACNMSTNHIEPILMTPEGSFAQGELDASTLFLSIDRNVIVSLCDQGDKVMIMARNPAGRFSWHSIPRFGNFSYNNNSPKLPESVPPPELGPFIPLDRPPKTIPSNDGKVSLAHVDMLDELLDYISEEHSSLSFGVPEFKVTMEPRTWPNRERKLFEPAVPIQKKGSMLFLRARQLLLSLGLTNHQELHILDKTPQMFRDLRGLDAVSSRECVKAGVIYIGRGQEREAQILGNVDASREYDAMLRGITWTVDLTCHTSYSGGLDSTSTTDGRAFYYASPTQELILHSTPHLMLQDASDTNFIKRKRHIGNDHVQLIWSESERDYRSGMMEGEFSSIQIVVHVEKQGYSINIVQDQRIEGRFGPLIEGVLVRSMNILTPALRTSIIAANRLATRLTSSETITPMQHRLFNIETIVDRHSRHDSSQWDGVISAMFYPEQPQKQVAQ